MAAGKSARSSSRYFSEPVAASSLIFAAIALPMPGIFASASSSSQIGKIAAEGFKRARGVGVSANLEWILVLQLEERGDFLKDGSDFALRHLVKPLAKIRLPSTFIALDAPLLEMVRRTKRDAKATATTKCGRRGTRRGYIRPRRL